MRPEALIYAGRELLPGWSVMDRLGEHRRADAGHGRA